MLGKATVDFVTKTMVALQATSMRKSNEWKRYFDTTPAELSGFWSLALDLDKSYRAHRFMVDVCCLSWSIFCCSSDSCCFCCCCRCCDCSWLSLRSHRSFPRHFALVSKGSMFRRHCEFVHDPVIVVIFFVVVVTTTTTSVGGSSHVGQNQRFV